MSFTAYATSGDLTDWLAPAASPANADSLLRAATFVVAEATNRNPYSDVPSTDDAAVLRDATCAQAASWAALGINPDALGIDGPAPVKKSSMLGDDVEYDTKASVQARSVAARELAPQAEAILTAAGLLWLPVPVGASQFDALPQWGQGRRWWPSPEPMSGEWEWPYGGSDWPFA